MGVRLPRRPAARIRLALLAALAVMALLAGLRAGATGDERVRSDPDPPAAEQTPEPQATRGERPRGAARLSLARRAGLLIVMRFAGTEAPAYVREALREGRSPGVILFRDNIASRESLAVMTRKLHRAAGGLAIVATDQEGGSVRNLDWAAPGSSQNATRSPQAAAAAARAAAEDLLTVGVNVNLAPVADVASVPGSIMGSRAFPGGAGEVAEIVAAAVRGYEGSGAVPVIKHFPGLGGSTLNTDDVPVTLERTPEQLATTDLPPFRAAVRAGAPVVMTSHAIYPALDPKRPASQSRAVLEGLLRRRLGFEGVIVTDSIEAAAISDRMKPETAAIRSLRAGTDLILTTGPGSHLRSLRAIIAEARRSPAFAERITEAADRVLALRDTLRARPRE